MNQELPLNMNKKLYNHAFSQEVQTRKIKGDF